MSPYPFFRNCEDDDPIYFSVLSYESKINVNVFAARVPRSQFSDITLLADVVGPRETGWWSDIVVLGRGSRKIAYFWVVPKFAHPVSHFQASICQATAGRRRWLPVGGGGGGGDSHALGVNSID